MDSDNEMAKLKWVLFALILFIVSGVMSYSELKYMLFGKTTEALVVRAQEAAALSRRSRGSLMVEYQFTDTDGKVRKEIDNISLDSPKPSGTIAVQYIPRSSDSRLAGHTQYLFVIIFAAALAVLAFFGVRFWRDYKEHERASRRS